jgi:hypothetical protein
MSTPGSERGSSREIARQMLERDAAGGTEVERSGDALERTFTRVSGNIRRSVGDDGYAALIARAALTTISDERVLTVIPRSDAMGIDIDIATAVEAHGVRAVGASLESLLAALVDILSDLIGEDMARTLLDHDRSPQKPVGPGRR